MNEHLLMNMHEEKGQFSKQVMRMLMSLCMIWMTNY